MSFSSLDLECLFCRNSNRYLDIDSCFPEEIDEKAYLEEAKLWIKEGASIVGGCCRTKPSYIKELSSNLKLKS